MKTLCALTALSALLVASPVMADNEVKSQTESTYKADTNGGYDAKDKVEHTDANGTTMTRTMEKKVDVDSDGNEKTTVDSKTTTDPKGLFNKKTTSTHDKMSKKNGKMEMKHKKEIDGKTVEETEQMKN